MEKIDEEELFKVMIDGRNPSNSFLIAGTSVHNLINKDGVVKLDYLMDLKGAAGVKGRRRQLADGSGGKMVYNL